MSRLIVTSGINIGLTKRIMRRLENELPAVFAKEEKSIRSIGNTFPKWPHPCMWPDEYDDIVALGRLMQAWSKMTNKLVREARPILIHPNGYVLMQHLGFDALTWGISRKCEPKNEEARQQFENEKREAIEFHHKILVPAIVKKGGFPLPLYIIPKASVEDATEDWFERSRKLRKRVSIAKIRRFIADENESMADYFSLEHGQIPPIYLAASLSEDEMVESAIRQLLARMRTPVEESQPAVA